MQAGDICKRTGHITDRFFHTTKTKRKVDLPNVALKQVENKMLSGTSTDAGKNEQR